MIMGRYLFMLGFIILLWSCGNQHDIDWSHYRGDAQSLQFSDIQSIHTGNVDQLEVAWVYHTGGADSTGRSQIQCNPLVINKTLYGTSPDLRLFAIDAISGEDKWVFDPQKQGHHIHGMGVNRGLAWYSSAGLNDSEKIIFYSVGDRLYAVNAEDGRGVNSFGDGGSISLRTGLEHPGIENLFIVNNTPGIVFNDLIILGSRVSESVGAVPGHIRAFDVNTGDLRWIFHTIPKPGELGYDTWPEEAYLRIGGANAWSGFSLDRKNGIVYVPTGSASFDFYGGDRHGDNLFANSIIALEAETGKYIWHFQTVHHDLWDKDLPLAPSLVELIKDGRNVPALIQPTKSGYLFVLNRLTGEPLYPIVEQPVPPSDLIKELASVTQPIPQHYPAFSRQRITTEDLASRTEEIHVYAQEVFNSMHHDNMFAPPSEEGTLIFPGFDGGAEWGGVSFDQRDHTLYINSNEVPWRLIMDKADNSSGVNMTYSIYCQSCHGRNLEGSALFGNVPSLMRMADRYDLLSFNELIRSGRGVMPAFRNFSQEEITSLYQYISASQKEFTDQREQTWPYPYTMRGYEKLYAPDGYPIINPPWGQLTAIDMNAGKIKWQVPLGVSPDLAPMTTGTENYGGPVATASGLIFIAATKDEKIRAFESKTGKILWEHDLPAAGYATPAIYEYGGKPFIVIACGGGKLGTKSGDSYIAFSLPAKKS